MLAIVFLHTVISNGAFRWHSLARKVSVMEILIVTGWVHHEEHTRQD